MALILVVEDDFNVANAMVDVLELIGHEASIARTGKSALELIERMHPDLVISDINMPVMTGLEFARTLRQGGSKLPLIALTGRCSEEDRRETAAAGFDLHMPKPYDVDELEAGIARLLTH